MRQTPPRNAGPRLQVLSSLRGRISFRFVPMRDRRDLALGVEAEVRRLHGVTGVLANPTTARVLVFFSAAVTPAEIAAAIAAAVPLTAAEIAVLPARPQQHAAEFAAHRRRLTIGGGVLAGLLVKRVLFGAGILSGNPLLMAISTAATLVSGYPFLRGGLRSLSGRGGLTTDTLVTTATLASLLLRESVTALIVLWLLNLGEYLQALTLRRVHHAIEDLLTLGDTATWLVAGGTEVRVSVNAVQPGDIVAVYMGERIPVDGVVLEGAGSVDEAPITGESLPSYKNPGDGVFAGTILEAGSLRLRADRIGSDTAVGRLIQRIEQARELQAPIETAAEGFSRRFVPFSFALALLVLAVTRDVRRAMTMLVIACPCAAGLSTPTAVSAAIGNAARRGVLIKGGVHLEAVANLDTVIFDKTGTLTAGRARVAHMLSVNGTYSPEEVLRIAASGELHSNHPLGIAIVRYTRELEVEIPNHEECEVIVGRGMRADLGGNRILVGSVRLLLESGVALPAALNTELDRFRQRGETVLCVAVNGSLIGLIGVRDVVRPEAREALQLLRQAGIKRLILLSGDSADAAEIVAGELGLTEYQGDLLPEDKFRRVRELQESGSRVAMIGDGINDAPALAIADVGMAMGAAGSDVAIEAADVALAGNDLRDVARVLHLSRRTLGVIRQNYALSLGVNALGLLAGAAGTLSPVFAAVLHNTSTIAVVLNSSRLIAYRTPVAGASAPAPDRTFASRPADRAPGGK